MQCFLSKITCTDLQGSWQVAVGRLVPVTVAAGAVSKCQQEMGCTQGGRHHGISCSRPSMISDCGPRLWGNLRTTGQQCPQPFDQAGLQ